MELVYQQYVNRLNYEPYKWPPDISLAQLHSRVSQQGPIDPSGVKCPCCNFQSKQQFKGWYSRDINEDCRGYGTAIPAFFGLLKYYTIATFTVIFFYSIYSIWALYHTCSTVFSYFCIKFGFFQFIEYQAQIAILEQLGDERVITTLVVLETITFYFLMAINFSSLVYIYNMNKRQKLQTLHTHFIQNAVILGNLPDMDPETIKKTLDLQNEPGIPANIQIIDTIPLKPMKHLYDLFHKRNIIFFTLMSRYVISKDPKESKRLNKQLVQIQRQLKKQKQLIQKVPQNHVIVFFRNKYQCTLVLDKYEFNQLSKIRYGGKQMLTNLELLEEAWDLPTYAVKAPDVNQIKWENAGQNIKNKMAGRIVASFIALLMICIFPLVLFGPVSWSLVTKSDDPSTLSTFQKLLVFLIGVLLFVLATWYQNYMTKVAKKRYPLSEFQASKFVLLTSMVFHLLFWIIMPVVYFSIPSSINQTTKLFVIAGQAQTFLFLQVLFILIDLPYRIWKGKKTESLSNQRVGFKYYQRQLHKLVEFRDFPLEQGIIVMFKIWSFLLFYVFYIPYMVIYIFLALVVLYIIMKRNFYLHYALRKAIPLQLEKSFLIYFVNFFALFQCYSYIFKAPYNWMIIVAVSITLATLLINIIFWKCIEPEYDKKKKIQKGKQQLLLSESNRESESEADSEICDSIQRVSNEYRRSYEIFIEENQNQQLDEQVDEYIRQLDSQLLQIQPQIKQSVGAIIQLAESQVEVSIN